jgi:hypothetical protein
MLLDIFDEVVQFVGLANIMQFITHNEPAYKAAKKRVAKKVWKILLVSLCSSLSTLDVEKIY